MKARDLLFVVGTIVVVVALYLLSLTGAKPPAIPPDAKHIAAKTKEECLVCHGKDKVYPMKVHPPKDQCFECHKYKEAGHGVMR
jgi:hypothetical protein